MKLITDRDALYVTGPDRYSPSLSGIPGARYLKSKFVWALPRSPVTMARLIKVASQLRDPVELDDGGRLLLEQWKRMKDDQFWKTEDARLSVEEALAEGGDPFQTATVPWVHQVQAERFMRNKEATYLALFMGTGKTLLVINQMLRELPERTLIVCPKSVIPVWSAEFEKHAPGHPFALVPLTKGTTTKKADDLAQAHQVATTKGQPLVVIVNYESAWRGMLGDALKAYRWDLAVLDEIHKIKDPRSEVTKYFRNIKAAKRIGMSGTPFPNNKLDGFAQIRWLDPGMFGTTFGFHKKQYAIMGGYGGKEVIGFQNEDNYNKLFDLIAFRVDKDVLNLLPSREVIHPVTLPSKAMAMLKKMQKEFVVAVEDGTIVTVQNALGKLIKMRSLTAGFILDEEGKTHEVHTAKVDALRDIIDSIGDEKIVVFCEFRWSLGAVRKLCGSMGLTYGEVSGKAMDLVDGRFPDDVQVLGVQPKSGSLGIDLTASRYPTFFDLGFSWGEHDQSLSRSDRGGQTHSVTNTYLMAPGSVDVQIYHALKAKEKAAGFVLDYVKRGGLIGA